MSGHDETPRPTPPAVRPRSRRRPSRTPQEARDRRRRWLTYALLAVSAVLMVNALVGDHGYFAMLRARHEIAALDAEISRVQQENQQLQEQLNRLATDPTALEEAARRDLGLIKPGETLVILKDAQPSRPK